MNARERLEELLADQVLWGLPDDERRELGELRIDGKADDLDHEFEEIAALTTIGLTPSTNDHMPDSLVQKLEAEALGFVAARRGLDAANVLDAIERDVQPSDSSPDANEGPAPVPIAWGWLLAAAAVLVGLLWAGFFQGEWNESPERVRSQIVAMADVQQIEWKTGKSPFSGTASGDVVWSQKLQKGYMRFRGLPVNDPNARQYQLWIIDGTRDQAQPVDGGVFDIRGAEVKKGGGEVLIPIRAALPVGEAVAFAVTVEKPGGVVVSKREHIVATAGL